jgi:hypothetical protein
VILVVILAASLAASLAAENFPPGSRLTYCLQQHGLQYGKSWGAKPRDMADFAPFIVLLAICETRIGTTPPWQRHRQRNL